MFDILGTSEGTETQCIGKIQSKTCTAGDASVNCDEYSFGFGVVKKK